MRRITPEERALFVAALSGRLPVTKTAGDRAKAHSKALSPAAPAPTGEADAVPAGKRRITAEEVDLFLEAIGLRKQGVALPAVKAPVPPVTPRPPKPTPAGLDGNTKKRLEKGAIQPSAKLDLHGMTEAAAHGALLTFLHTAHRRGDRLVLIVTGKGALEADEAKFKERYRGVLRRSVPRWLEEAPMASIIADKRWAHRRHGGDGALYIYLRKSV